MCINSGIAICMPLIMVCMGIPALTGCSSPVGAGDAADYTRMNLPDGAIARLGKGGIVRGESAVVFSPDGRTLAVATTAGIWLCDTRTRQEYALLTEFDDCATSIDFSPDGKWLAAGYFWDGNIKLWSVEERRVITRFKAHKYGIHTVLFSPDGKILASGGEGVIKFWTVPEGREITQFKGHGQGTGIFTFSPDGALLAGVDDRTIIIWSVSDQREVAVLEDAGRGIRSVEFSPDGSMLASTSEDGFLRLWSVAERRETAKRKGQYQSVAFSRDGTVLVCGASWGDDFTVWSLPDMREMAVLKIHGGKSIHSISFSPDGKTLAGACWDRIQFWSVPKWKEKETLDEYMAPPRSVEFSRDGRFLLAGSAQAWIWSVPDQRLMLKPEPWTYVSAFSPDGKLIAIDGGHHKVKLLSVEDGHEVAVLKPLKHETRNADICSFSFSPDGELLASTRKDKSLKLWSIEERRELESLPGDNNENRYHGVVFSPDGKRLAGWGCDSRITLWSVPGLAEVGILEGQTNWVADVAFSPDSKLLASGSDDGTIKMWSVAKKRVVGTFEGDGMPVVSVRFLQDGKTLLSTHPAGRQQSDRFAMAVKLWDVAGQREISTCTIKGGGGGLAVSPDGKILATGDFLGSLMLWDMGWMDANTWQGK